MAKILEAMETAKDISNDEYYFHHMDDGGTSDQTYGAEFDGQDVINNTDNLFRSTYHANGLFTHDEIDIFRKSYRFGLIDPYDSIGTCTEYLFFTKPDLNIYPRDNETGRPDRFLAPYLQTQPLWLDLASRYPEVIKCLQSSLRSSEAIKPDPFNHLLFNKTQGNMEVPPLSAEMVETPTNMYGVGYTYRGSSEAGNDTYSFSLEFKDTKYLHVYKFFEAYEDYETIKHHGLLPVYQPYIVNKRLYDQYAIYKILVGEDGETIVYAGKAYGVKSKSLPRDTFTNTTFDNGISYSIDFEAAFYDDRPNILYEFNNLAREYYNSLDYQLDIYNTILGQTDGRPGMCAYIHGLPNDKDYRGYERVEQECRNVHAPGGRVFKLKWRGNDRE